MIEIMSAWEFISRLAVMNLSTLERTYTSDGSA